MCEIFFEYRCTYEGGAMLDEVNGKMWQYQKRPTLHLILLEVKGWLRLGIRSMI